ncbi:MULTISPECIES: DMT family transporter [Actinomyces]|uniref:DMT family transporter n=1 Tax=Actinomyces marmotae TaxID=2737173 RepID=A0A6M8B536_9ACTO|nr:MULTISPECIES: DMT family transporter [Actinomyces]QKD79740.1 DMT family transporter [Actinomyces marmotae]
MPPSAETASSHAAGPALLSSLLPTACLLLVTAIWGSTFFMLKDALDHVGAADFLAVRFAIAGGAACALSGRRLRALSRAQALTGIGVGAVYGLAQIAQTVGLRYAPASTAGFITALYVVITPMLALVLLRARVSRATWVAAVLALGGVGALSLDGLALDAGIPLLLASAFLYALHIVLLGRLVKGRDPLSLTALQMLGICAVLWPAALPGGVRVPMTWSVWGPLLWMALASGLLALLVQTWAQARMSAVRAVVVMTFEPVFASLFAILAGQEPMTWRLLVGGGLALTAMLLSELGPVVRAEGLARRGGRAASEIRSA